MFYQSNKNTVDLSKPILKRKKSFLTKKGPNRGTCYHFKKQWAKRVTSNKI